VIEVQGWQVLGSFSTEVVLFQALYEIKVNYDDIIAKTAGLSWSNRRPVRRQLRQEGGVVTKIAQAGTGTSAGRRAETRDRIGSIMGAPRGTTLGLELGPELGSALGIALGPALGESLDPALGP
jgi:hypothetical protein